MTALNAAVEKELLDKNPMELGVKAPKVEKTIHTTLSVGQVQRFLRVAGENHSGTALILLVTTSLRPNEVLGLRWADVDLERGELHVSVQLSWRRGPWTWKERKGGIVHSIRLLSVAVAALRRQQEAQAIWRQSGDWEEHDLVNTTGRGTPIRDTNLTRRYFKRVLELAELPDMPLYALRRTAVTLLSQTGVHPEHIRGLTGHTTTQMIRTVYDQTRATTSEIASRELERLLVGTGVG